MTQGHSLVVENLHAGYGERIIIKGMNLTIAPGSITAIVGANASGKSTLLRAMARLITPAEGGVILNGIPVHKIPAKQAARTIGLLPQSPIAPEGMTVADLVGRGRHPHQSLFSRWNAEDDRAVAAALEAAGTGDIAEHPLDELSGGQRQRVWIAMVLAQETDILLLDEPTTFLDVGYQIDILNLLAEMNRKRGTTIVMVLHELNMASRYADYLAALVDGRVHASGTPAEVLTRENMRAVFDIECMIIDDPLSGRPHALPIGRCRAEGGDNGD